MSQLHNKILKHYSVVAIIFDEIKNENPHLLDELQVFTQTIWFSFR